MRREVQREEEEGVAERAPADRCLARDVHGGEAEAREDADDAEVEELAVAVQRASPHQTSTTMIAISAMITSSASNRLPRPAWGACDVSWSAIAAWMSSAETTIVSTAAGAGSAGGGGT